MSTKGSIIAVLVAVLSGPVLALANSKPVDGEIMLVIAPPWMQRDEIIHQAGGVSVGPAVALFGFFAFSPDDAYASSLRSQGAWMVINGRSIAAICGISA